MDEYDETTGEVLRTPPATFDYKERLRPLPGGLEVHEYSLDGGKSWRASGPAVERWEPNAEGGRDLDRQKVIGAIVDGYFTERVVVDRVTGAGYDEIPPALRKNALGVKARAWNRSEERRVGKE